MRGVSSIMRRDSSIMRRVSSIMRRDSSIMRGDSSIMRRDSSIVHGIRALCAGIRALCPELRALCAETSIVRGMQVLFVADKINSAFHTRSTRLRVFTINITRRSLGIAVALGRQHFDILQIALAPGTRIEVGDYHVVTKINH
ncbi:hypothetical protein Lbir_1775 [Legionella birminghamensis]|uniref:Uncharacterized protein n=1 Tax=Legionella birminghamensis TaxID=28083 RepID=A0A378I6L3_9GAMM|nr:hypothetical protein Lbir_1775 [Legionella birminghamensis]STX30400.1 Uncharacterised protein [Legionella birminghamensis]